MSNRLPVLKAHWRSGPRTSAWDELWRRILTDVSSETHHSEDANGTVAAPENDHNKAASSGSGDVVDGGPDR